MNTNDSPHLNYRNIELELFILINSFRQEPKTLLPLLESLIPCFEGRVYTPKSGGEGYVTQEGVMVVYEAIEFIQKQAPLPPFKFSKGLFLAAQAHLEDIGQNGLASHKGSDGSILSERVDQFGQWRVLVAENIAFNDSTSEAILLNFVLDDGNVNRGHRENLFNQKLEVLGIACGSHSVYEHCAVLNFAGQMEEYLDLGETDPKFQAISGLIADHIGGDVMNMMFLEDDQHTKENDDVDIDESDSDPDQSEDDQMATQFSEEIAEESYEDTDNQDTPRESIKNGNLVVYRDFDSFKKRPSNASSGSELTPVYNMQSNHNSKLEKDLFSPIPGITKFLPKHKKKMRNHRICPEPLQK